jgi:hypothetical protein
MWKRLTNNISQKSEIMHIQPLYVLVPEEQLLSKEEIISKIDHLEESITRCYIQSGSRFCVNREARVRLLKSYLEGK